MFCSWSYRRCKRTLINMLLESRTSLCSKFQRRIILLQFCKVLARRLHWESPWSQLGFLKYWELNTPVRFRFLIFLYQIKGCRHIKASLNALRAHLFPLRIPFRSSYNRARITSSLGTSFVLRTKDFPTDDDDMNYPGNVTIGYSDSTWIVHISHCKISMQNVLSYYYCFGSELN